MQETWTADDEEVEQEAIEMTKNSHSNLVRRDDRALILAVEALALYADPTSYHAIAFMADRPAGWFADDFSHDKDYGRSMPGKRARKALAKIQKLVTTLEEAAPERSAAWSKAAPTKPGHYWVRFDRKRTITVLQVELWHGELKCFYYQGWRALDDQQYWGGLEWWPAEIMPPNDKLRDGATERRPSSPET